MTDDMMNLRSLVEKSADQAADRGRRHLPQRRRYRAPGRCAAAGTER